MAVSYNHCSCNAPVSRRCISRIAASLLVLLSYFHCEAHDLLTRAPSTSRVSRITRSATSLGGSKGRAGTRLPHSERENEVIGTPAAGQLKTRSNGSLELATVLSFFRKRQSLSSSIGDGASSASTTSTREFSRSLAALRQARRWPRKKPKKSPPPLSFPSPPPFQSPPPPPPPQSSFPANQIVDTCAKSGPATVTFSATSTNVYTWKGFGTSLAWFANYIGGMPQSNLNALLDLLFDKTKGLGFNIVRYNIGAGSSPVYSPQYLKKPQYRHRDMPAFKASHDAPYDWSQDANQRAVLFGARARGVDTYIAFANSPPWFYTISKDSAGAARPLSPNLDPSNYTAFVKYLVDVVEQFQTRPGWKLTFQFLEPFNEPEEGYWRKGNIQEGCFFTPRQLADITPLVQAELARRNLKTAVVGVDSWARKAPAQYAAMTPDTISKLAAFHVHGYVATRGLAPGRAAEVGYTSMRNFAASKGKEVWVTEWGPLFGTGVDLDSSLFMARQIVEQVNFMQASAFCFWQAIDLYFEWTLVYLPSWDYSSPFSYALSKRFFILRHFTRTVSPGSFALIQSTPKDCRHGVVAFYDPTKTMVSIHIVNQRTSSRDLTFSLQNFNLAQTGKPLQVGVYRTSQTEDHILVATQVLQDLTSGLSITANPRSFTTVVVQGLLKP